MDGRSTTGESYRSPFRKEAKHPARATPGTVRKKVESGAYRWTDVQLNPPRVSRLRRGRVFENSTNGDGSGETYF